MLATWKAPPEYALLQQNLISEASSFKKTNCSSKPKPESDTESDNKIK